MGFLLNQGIATLPVNPFDIALQNGWRVYRYSEFAVRIQRDVEYLQTNYDKDGFTFWSKRDNNFIICYNESASQEESRWTLTHEIGHIYLRHISEACPLLARNGISNPLYEIEAERFTRRVLCPPVVLNDCEASGPEEVVNLCGIPEPRAEMVFAYIRDFTSDSRTSPLESELKVRFSAFIVDYKKNEPLATKSYKNSRLYNQAARIGGILLWVAIWRIRRNPATKC